MRTLLLISFFTFISSFASAENSRFENLFTEALIKQGFVKVQNINASMSSEMGNVLAAMSPLPMIVRFDITFTSGGLNYECKGKRSGTPRHPVGIIERCVQLVIEDEKIVQPEEVLPEISTEVNR